MPSKPPGPRYSQPESLFEPGTRDYEAAVADLRTQREQEERDQSNRQQDKPRQVRHDRRV